MAVGSQWTSEIQFGIGIQKTEPSRTELSLEFRKFRNVEKKNANAIFSEFEHLFTHHDIIFSFLLNIESDGKQIHVF